MPKALGRRELFAAGMACIAAPSLGATHRRLNATASPEGFSGTLLIARGGRTVFRRDYGLADVERGLSVGPGTRFAFGSGTKWLTSVAVLKLVEAGRLALDAPLAIYLPELPRATGERVRLAHLLSNTSGIPDLLSKALRSEPALRTSPELALVMTRRFGGGELSFAPGSAFDYSPLNWVLVNAIVTRAADRPFADALRELVFAPLGVGSMMLADDGWSAIPDMAAAYTMGMPPARKMEPVPAFVSASGNAVGTAEDAMRVAHAVFATGFLRPESRVQLVRVRWQAEDYALGGRVHAIGRERWAWETGKVAGYRALVAQNLARDETVVVFNNREADQSVLSTWVEAIVRG